jgi:hypothetical protein
MEGESMSTRKKSRRSFLVESAMGLNAAWVAANYPGILAAQQFVHSATQKGQLPQLAVFTEAQAAEIEAMTVQIIPTDDAPGAHEAHCVYFIDRALATFAKNNQPAYIQGLQDLQTKTQQLFPDASRFSALALEKQLKVLTRRRSSIWSERTPSSAFSRRRSMAATSRRLAGS